MKKLRFLSIFLVACLLLTLFPTAITASSTYSVISGNLSLPGNDKAPSGGVKVTLKINTDNLTQANKNDDVSVIKELIIPRGKRSVDYQIRVPKSSNTRARYSVSYTVENGYAPFGYYSKSGTTPIKTAETQINLNAGNVKDIDITLLEGKTISGKIIFGNQTTTPSNDMKFTLTAMQEGSDSKSDDDDIIILKDITIPKNKKEAAYTLIVPLNSAGKGYKLFYQYESGTYKETGYYYNKETSRTSSKVTLIDVSNKITGVNLTTLPFTNISGKIALPDNKKAPSGGIDIDVTALNLGTSTRSTDDFYIKKSVTIPKNANAVDYSLTVPVKQVGYYVSYKAPKNLGYVTEGFYSTSGTKTSRNSAKLVASEKKPVTGINLTLVEDEKQKPAPTSKYDLNEDGYIDIFDLLELAKVIVAQYEKDGVEKHLKHLKNHEIKADDFNAVKEAFKPFDNNRYKLKMFNSMKPWFNGFYNGDQNYNWNYDWNYNWDWYDADFDYEEWWKSYWKSWNNDGYDWKNWNDDWEEFIKKNNGNNGKKKGK